MLFKKKKQETGKKEKIAEKAKKTKETQKNHSLSKSQKKALKEKEKRSEKSLKQKQLSIEQKNEKRKKRLKAEAAPKSVQQSIKYKYMFQNGIAKNSGNGFGGIYSKTLKFSDINYQVAQRNEQIDMFSKYCELMNYFDPKINVQISVHNRRIDMDDFKRNMFLKYADDGMDELRDEYNKMSITRCWRTRHCRDRTALSEKNT